MKTYSISGGQHGYVNSYYHNGVWLPVEPWNVREDRGEPPCIIIGNAEQTSGKHKGKISYNAGCKTSGFYDWVNYLRPYLSEGEVITFTELEHVAELMGRKGVFTRRQLIYHGGNGYPFTQGLSCSPENVLIKEYGSQNSDALIPFLEQKGFANIQPCGYHAIYFDAE